MTTEQVRTAFTSMAFAPDGRLRIVNEAGKAFLVDVKARTVEPAA